MIIPPAHRTDVLAAIALVARSRQPMAEGLAQLADRDPLLARWAHRLAVPLRSGAPLPEVLRRQGLISRREAEMLGRDVDVAPALDRLVNGMIDPPRGLVLVTWLPTAFALAAAIPAAVILLLLVVFKVTYATVYRDLGIMLPILTQWVITPEQLLLHMAALVALMVAVQGLLRRTRGLRHVLHLWCPEVHRQSALLRLIGHARRGDDQPLHLGRVQRWMSWILVRARRPARPAWDLDYRTWMFLSRFRLRAATRREAGCLPDLASRLIRLGIVTLDQGSPAWATAEGICRQRLEHALGGALLIVTPPLVFTAWITGIAILISLQVPLIKILEELGKQT